MSLPEAGPDPAAASRYVAERLLLSVREDLGRADLKASVLLSGALALPALVLSGGRPTVVAGSGVRLALLLVGGALWAAGAFLLLGVIMPRSGTVRDIPSLTFYADALDDPDPDSLLLGVTEAGLDPVRWLLLQFQDVSVILAAKYRWLRWSVALLGTGLAFVTYPLGAG